MKGLRSQTVLTGRRPVSRAPPGRSSRYSSRRIQACGGRQDALQDLSGAKVGACHAQNQCMQRSPRTLPTMRPGSPDRAWYRSSRRASRRPQPGWDTIAAFAQNSTLIEPMTTRVASGLRQARCRPARRTCPRTGQRGTTHPRRPSCSNKARLTALGAGNLVHAGVPPVLAARPPGDRRGRLLGILLGRPHLRAAPRLSRQRTWRSAPLPLDPRKSRPAWNS